MSSMSHQVVKCRCCGHQVLAREIMRTDLYERAPGQNFVYVKFRCRRCKRLGQTFVPEARWDWKLLEPARDEMSDGERDRLSDAGPISDAELLDFHLRLKSLDDLSALQGENATSPGTESKTGEAEPRDVAPRPDVLPRLDLKPERKDDPRDGKSRDNREISREAGRESSHPNAHEGGKDTRLGANGLNGEVRPED